MSTFGLLKEEKRMSKLVGESKVRATSNSLPAAAGLQTLDNFKMDGT